MKVRARFCCRGVVRHGDYPQIDVSLSAVTADGGEECKAFWEATPAGVIDLCLLNPALQDFFKPGKDYYVDFEIVDD